MTGFDLTRPTVHKRSNNVFLLMMFDVGEIYIYESRVNNDFVNKSIRKKITLTKKLILCKMSHTCTFIDNMCNEYKWLLTEHRWID